MKFKPRKVKFMWDKKLKGKTGYVCNNINKLIESVEGKCCNDIIMVRQGEHDAFPFKDDIGCEYRFFYPVRRDKRR